ncbi:MAG TPA: hypothetical protein VF792_08600 [Ktedonobacterales bacterium]
MELAEKLRRLRTAEGLRRGLWRAMTQLEVTEAMRREIGGSLSQAYLSQLESGKRVHLTSVTREALARFYHVHPGYLVSDPSGVTSDADAPLPPPFTGADAAMLDEALTRLAALPEPARALRLLDRVLRLPPEALDELETLVSARLARDASARND